MKVLILGSKEYPFGQTDDFLPSGGMEGYIQELVRGLAKLKITPILVTRKFKNSLRFEIEKGVNIHRVPWLSGFWLRGPSFNFFSFLKSLNLNFDVILTNGVIATFFGFILSKLKNKPLLAIPHGLVCTQDKYGKIISKIVFVLEKLLYAKTNIISLSEQENKKITQMFGKCNIAFIPTPINFTKYTPNKKSSKQLAISFVGRLTKVKGIEYFLKAIPKLQGNPKIIIAGSGADGNYYRKIAPKNVEFLGFIEPTGIFNKSDIYVLPSLSEGLPLSLLEAMAAGCACVVTDIGLPVKHNETALVVPPADSKKLAEALNLLIKDARLRKKLGANARRYVKQFSWDKAALQFKNLFETLNNKHNSECCKY